jgi:phosphoribosyl-AMP cyclohydrolase
LKDFLVNEIHWTTDGLVAAIAQDWLTGEVLMMAWMNQEALVQTSQSGEAAYWSRSRQQLWRKGETSGHRQRVHAMRLDCDGDALLLMVEQLGDLACHTGRRSCFYRQWDSEHWQIIAPVLKSPEDIYGPSHE